MTTASVVGVGPVSEDELVRVARYGAGVVLGDEALAAIEKSRQVVEALADDVEPHYGISTGFGALATKHIPVAQRALLQRSLIRSHAAGSGPEVEREVVRALMLLRLSTLATGRTGVRASTASALAACSTTASHPSCTSTARWAAPATWPRWLTVALALLGEGVGARRARRVATGRRRARRVRASSRSPWPRKRAWR